MIRVIFPTTVLFFLHKMGGVTGVTPRPATPPTLGRHQWPQPATHRRVPALGVRFPAHDGAAWLWPDKQSASGWGLYIL
jgi:hypothetical protein